MWKELPSLQGWEACGVCVLIKESDIMGAQGISENNPWAVWKQSGFSMPLSHSGLQETTIMKKWFSLYFILPFIYLFPFIYCNAFPLFISFSIAPMVIVFIFFSSFSSLAVKGKNYSPHYFQAFLSQPHSRKEVLCMEELSCYILIYLCIVEIPQQFLHSFYLPESSAWIPETVCFCI